MSTRFVHAGSASWAAANSGSWNAAANWSPATIPNSAGDNGTISVTGGAYTVTLNTPQTVSTLAITSPNATLNHTAVAALNATTISVSAGTYSLNSAIINGASISTSGSGTFVFANNGNNVFANNTTYIGDLIVNAGRIRLQSGSTFSGASGTFTSSSIVGYEQTGTLNGKTINAIGSTFAIDGPNTLTLGSTTSVRGSGGSFGAPFNVGGGSLGNGLVNNGTIITTGGQYIVSPNNLTNNSFMGASVAGSRLTINANLMTNAGTIEATGGGSITIDQFQAFSWTNSATGRIRVTDAASQAVLSGSWSNAGTLVISAGTLSLDGTFTTAGIGTIARTGGSVDIAGFMNNSGTTLSLNATTGSYQLSGGNISGGTVTSVGGATLVFANNGANLMSNNAALVGDLVLTNGRVRFQSGANFTGGAATLTNSIVGYEQTMVVNNKTFTLDGGILAIEGPNTLTLGATSAVRGGGNASFGSTFSVGGGTLGNGLVNNGTITANNGQLTVNPNNFTNNALANAAAGARLTINANSMTNAGTIEASGGGSVTIDQFQNFTWTNGPTGRIRVADANSLVLMSGIWSNAGTIILNQGTIQLDGTFTRAGIGTIIRTAGTIDIAGFMDNTAGTLTLNATTGDYRLNGGAISGGTITSSGGGTLVFANNGFNRFADNATLIGDLILNSGRLRLQSGSSFTGANGTLTNSSILGYEQTGSLTGKSINLDGALLAIEGANTLTLASSTTVRGGNTSFLGQTFAVGGNNGLINNGTITTTTGNFQINPINLTNNASISAGAGARLQMRIPGTFVNNGTLEASGGGSVTINQFEVFTTTNSATGRIRVADANSLLLIGGNWSNAGTIILNQGTLLLDGTFTRSGIGTIVRTGGTLDITGFLNNAGGTLTLNATTGDYRLNGGVISGGTITSSGGGTLLFTNNGNNRLADNAMLVGDLILNNARIRLQSGSGFTGANVSATNNSALSYEQTGTLTGTTISFDGIVAVEGNNTLTLASDTSARGRGSIGQGFALVGAPSLINNGTIGANVAAMALQINPTNFTNNGTIEATNGARLNIPAATNMGGSPGRIRSNGPGSIVNIQGGTYTMNQPCLATNHGMIYFQGSFTKAATFDASGRFVFDYTGAGNNPFAQIKADVISGYAGGAWTGPGINSSAAAVTPRTAVGYAESTLLGLMGGNFAGFQVDSTAVLVRYTLAGDNNLDGTVNISDFSILASKFNQPGMWTDGDTTYDNSVNIGDFALLASNFNLTLGVDTARPLVPEPAMALLAPLTLMSLARRRRLPRR